MCQEQAVQAELQAQLLACVISHLMLSAKQSMTAHVLCATCSPTQFAEETKRADRIVSWGILLALPINFLFGLMYILVLLFCLPVRSRPCLHALTNRSMCLLAWRRCLHAVVHAGYGLIFCSVDFMQREYLGPDAQPFTVPQLFYDIFQDRFGLASLGIVVSLLPCIAIFNTTVMSMVTASRSAPPQVNSYS